MGNVFRVLIESFKAPLEKSFIDLETGQIKSAVYAENFDTLGTNSTKTRKRIPEELTPNFKLAVIIVLLITVLSGIAEIILANVWLNPTSNQQSAFEGFSFAWKAGIGAILGLVGSKVT